MRLLKTKKNFRREFKRQVKYAIAAAVGLMIAYAWKESIFQSTQKFVERITESAQFVTSSLGTSVIITVIGVLIIIISSKLLKD
jgi:flagellum-specific peptidoglycan hydrolase FlgJ